MWRIRGIPIRKDHAPYKWFWGTTKNIWWNNEWFGLGGLLLLLQGLCRRNKRGSNRNGVRRKMMMIWLFLTTNNPLLDLTFSNRGFLYASFDSLYPTTTYSGVQSLIPVFLAMNFFYTTICCGLTFCNLTFLIKKHPRTQKMSKEVFQGGSFGIL